MDGSDPSSGALHWAVAEAARRTASLDVVNAYEYDRVAAPIGAVLTVDQAELEKASRALVEEMVAGAVGPGPPTECRRGHLVFSRRGAGADRIRKRS